MRKVVVIQMLGPLFLIASNVCFFMAIQSANCESAALKSRLAIYERVIIDLTNELFKRDHPKIPTLTPGKKADRPNQSI